MVHKRLFNKICCSLVGRCKSGKALDFSRNKGAVREAVLLVTVCYVKWHPVCRNFPFPGHPVQLCNTFPVGLHSELDREELLLLNTAQIPELAWPRHLQVDNQMPTLASVQITLIYSLELVWSCPARTMPPRLSVIVCRLIRKATHLKHIWGRHGGGLVALACAITKLQSALCWNQRTGWWRTNSHSRGKPKGKDRK